MIVNIASHKITLYLCVICSVVSKHLRSIFFVSNTQIFSESKLTKGTLLHGSKDHFLLLGHERANREKFEKSGPGGRLQDHRP